jgi:hypothetical protein
VHHNRFIFKRPTRRTNYPNIFGYKILHVSGIFSAYHQEFSTVLSPLVSFMQGFDESFQADVNNITHKIQAAEQSGANMLKVWKKKNQNRNLNCGPQSKGVKLKTSIRILDLALENLTIQH